MDRSHARFVATKYVLTPAIGDCHADLVERLPRDAGHRHLRVGRRQHGSGRMRGAQRPPGCRDVQAAGFATNIAMRAHRETLPSKSARYWSRTSKTSTSSIRAKSTTGSTKATGATSASWPKPFRPILVVHIELEDFDLYKGKTLYQGRADVTVSVYDMSKIATGSSGTAHLGEVLYPVNSGIPAQDKPVQQFEREFVDIVADRVATNFYRHDPNAKFRDGCDGESVS